jgi:two-component system response regulator PilR (NtrC family)
MQILVVDDEVHLRNSLAAVLGERYDVQTCESAVLALDILKKTSFDLVITDHQMAGLTGLEFIKQAKQTSPETSFMLMTAFGGVNQAVQAIQCGADDYFLKPFDISEIEHRVERVLELKKWRIRSSAEKENQKSANRLSGKSQSIQNAKAFVTKVADSTAPVLLLGPSGTGKEVMAKSIHEVSSRADMPFVGINCASLNENLIESELFGHEKGAFTGAVASKPGKFEFARGGTLFLDEIGELAPGLQAKLLRVLQEKEFCRLGSVKTIKSDVRVIAATHRDLKAMTQDGRFREDLFFRLNVLSFHLSPLKDRKEDLPELIEYFWQKARISSNCKSQLSSELLQYFENYSFPGNIRELQNILERLAVLGPRQGVVPASLLPPEFFGMSAAKVLPFESPETLSSGLDESLENLERKLIGEAMKKADNNQTQAAQILKITRGTLQYKLKKFAA